MMARVSDRSASTTFTSIVCLMIALPGLLIISRATSIPPNAPPELDRFLAAVRDVTPRGACLLVYGAPPALIFYRATYLLYPRTVFSAAATDYAHGTVAPALTWHAAQHLAQRDGARYVIAWAVPLAARGTVLLRFSAGTLVEVPREGYWSARDAVPRSEGPGAQQRFGLRTAGHAYGPASLQQTEVTEQAHQNGPGRLVFQARHRMPRRGAGSSTDAVAYAGTPIGVYRFELRDRSARLFFGTRAFGASGVPVTDNQDTVYVATAKGAVFDLWPDGRVRWRYDTGRTAPGALALYPDGSVLVTTRDPSGMTVADRDRGLTLDVLSGRAASTCTGCGDQKERYRSVYVHRGGL